MQDRTPHNLPFVPSKRAKMEPSPHLVGMTPSSLQIPQELLSLQQQQEPQPLAPPAESAASQQQSQLLQLPSEIRNRIYELALLEGEPNPIIEVRKTYRTPHLLSTCRQLRHEAGSLYYGSAVFLLRAERGSSHQFVHRSPSGLCVLWLATRAFRGSRLIRRVCVDLYAPTSTNMGWMEVWKPIALQIVRDQIVAMKLGEGIEVSAR